MPYIEQTTVKLHFKNSLVLELGLDKDKTIDYVQRLVEEERILPNKRDVLVSSQGALVQPY